jgi:hypothetical protein
MTDFSRLLLTIRFDFFDSWLRYCLGVYGHICLSLLGLSQNGREVLVCALANGIRDMVVY